MSLRGNPPDDIYVKVWQQDPDGFDYLHFDGDAWTWSLTGFAGADDLQSQYAGLEHPLLTGDDAYLSLVVSKDDAYILGSDTLWYFKDDRWIDLSALISYVQNQAKTMIADSVRPRRIAAADSTHVVVFFDYGIVLYLDGMNWKINIPDLDPTMSDLFKYIGGYVVGDIDQTYWAIETVSGKIFRFIPDRNLSASIVPPQIISLCQATRDTHIDIDETIQVMLSADMDPATITGQTVFLKRGQQIISGNVSYHNRTVSFTPLQDLDHDTSYTFVISTDVKDLNGLSLAQEYSTAYATGPAPYQFNNRVCSDDDWCWQNPLPHGNCIYGIWPSGSENVYFAGEKGSILKYHDYTWDILPTHTENDLYDIWGQDDSNLFAIGSAGTVLHFDGLFWTAMDSHTQYDLKRIWADSSQNIYAVGANGTLINFDGTQWTGISLDTTSNLNDIGGVNANDIYVASENGAIFHFQENNWNSIDSFTGVVLWGVWPYRADAIYVATDTDWLLNFDGMFWDGQEVFCENKCYAHGYRAIWGTSDTDIFLGGDNLDPYDQNALIHFNGQQWLAHSDPQIPLIRNIRGTGADDVYAVGCIDQGGPVYHFDGQTWSAMTQSLDNAPIFLFGNQQTGVFALGKNLTFLQYKDCGWEEIDPLTTPSFSTAFQQLPENIFTLATSLQDSGHLSMHGFDGKLWRVLDPFYFSGLTVTDFAVLSNTNIIVIGKNATIFNYNGETWKQIQSPVSQNLNGIWKSPQKHLFVVGDQGTLLYYDSQTWSALDSGLSENLIGVFGFSEQDVYAVGQNGTILHFDGSIWSIMDSGTNAQLNSVWGSQPGDLFVAGERGLILHYDGQTWVRMESGTHQALLKVMGTEDNDVFVTFGNAVLHYAKDRTIPPQVLEIMPSTLVDENTGAQSAGTSVAVTFTKPLNPSSLTNDTVAVYQGQTPVSGNITYQNKVMTFTPVAPFNAGSTYRIVIDKEIKDIYGNSMGTGFESAFMLPSASSQAQSGGGCFVSSLDHGSENH